jgi:transcriptional regulator with XRE-family HTH domain
MIEEHDLSTKEGRIAFVLESSGHNPNSMAKLIGCKAAAIYQWLNGSTKNIKENLLWSLADVTGFEARWISNGQGPAKIDSSIKHANQVLMAMQPSARYTAVRLLDTLAEPGKSNGTQ